MWDPKCVFSFAANMEFVSSPGFLVQRKNIWICDEPLSSLFSTCYHPASEAFVLLCPSNSSLPPKVSHWKTTKIKGLGLVRTLTFTSGITIIENPFRHQVLLQISPRFSLGLGLFTQEKGWACSLCCHLGWYSLCLLPLPPQRGWVALSGESMKSGVKSSRYPVRGVRITIQLQSFGFSKRSQFTTSVSSPHPPGQGKLSLHPYSNAAQSVTHLVIWNKKEFSFFVAAEHSRLGLGW